jgi:hypothetical protein
LKTIVTSDSRSGVVFGQVQVKTSLPIVVELQGTTSL